MPLPLVFVRDGHGWLGEGAVRRGDFRGPELYAAARAWWGRLAAEDPSAVAFGSFPFDPRSPAGASLLVPQRAVRVEGVLPRLGVAPLPTARVREGAMTAAAYQAAVAAAAAEIAAGSVQKVVLARDVIVDPDGPVDAGALLDALHAAHPDTSVFGVDGLFGASPETLITVHEGRVTARVLAGTAASGAGTSLLNSAKDVAEHAFAVDSVLDALRPHLADLAWSREPYVLELPHLSHLATDVAGRIADGTDVLALVEALHPTAAVAGTPTPVAMARIRALEAVDRGRYAGPVGWMNARGDGEWAIALRCAQLGQDGRFRAFAGAGVMAESDPAAELAETELKLRPILDALRAP
ncbi:MAG TPA: chorismate-binding protein [Microbacteriaceae bacterium]|nr:chorismate-binding protein [Microbacteriaceae bacterium]